MRILALLILLISSQAHARGAPDKPPARAVDRVKLERELRKRIGKPPAKLINVVRLHTHEVLPLDADPKAPAIRQAVADDFFRCHFTNQRPETYDLRLIGILIAAALKFQVDTVHVVSGYRAPKYNLSLRKKGREVGRDSQHTYGHAVDFRLPGVPTTRLRDWVRSLRLGGVGFYPESQFVHADVGKIRTWTGR